MGNNGKEMHLVAEFLERTCDKLVSELRTTLEHGLSREFRPESLESLNSILDEVSGHFTESVCVPLPRLLDAGLATGTLAHHQLALTSQLLRVANRFWGEHADVSEMARTDVPLAFDLLSNSVSHSLRDVQQIRSRIIAKSNGTPANRNSQQTANAR